MFLTLVLAGCDVLGSNPSTSATSATDPATNPSTVPSDTDVPSAPTDTDVPTDPVDTGVACVDGGDGAIELFTACVDGVCGQVYSSPADFLASAEAVLGPADCDPASDTCSWDNGDLEARVHHDSADQPATDSDMFRVEWTLHTGSRQTISGLSVGADVACFQSAHGPGLVTGGTRRWSQSLAALPGQSGFVVQPADGTVETLTLYWEWEE